jgi:hypothetical protein
MVGTDDAESTKIAPPSDVDEQPSNVSSLIDTSPLPVNDRREQAELERAGNRNKNTIGLSETNQPARQGIRDGTFARSSVSYGIWKCVTGD